MEFEIGLNFGNRHVKRIYWNLTNKMKFFRNNLLKSADGHGGLFDKMAKCCEECMKTVLEYQTILFRVNVVSPGLGKIN